MSACPTCCHYMASRKPLPLPRVDPARERLSEVALLLVEAIGIKSNRITARQWLMQSADDDVSPELIEEALSYCPCPDGMNGKDRLQSGLVNLLCYMRDGE